MKRILTGLLVFSLLFGPSLGTVEAARRTKKVRNVRKTVIADKDKSKYRVVKFEADWCAPCIRMRPHFKSAAVKKALSLYAKNTVGTPATNPYYGDHKFVIDADRDRDWVIKYKVVALPTILILDSQNRVVKRGTGYMSEAQLLDFLGPLSVETDAVTGEVKEVTISFGVVTLIKWAVILFARGLLYLLD